MKIFLYLLLVLTFVSCGDKPEEDAGDFGNLLKPNLSKKLSSRSGNYLSTICRALNFKYDEYRGRNSVFEFSYTGKLCDDVEISSKNGNNLGYLTIDGSRFISSTGTNTPMFFSEYETRYSGVLAKLCQSVSRSISGVPAQVLDGNLLYIFGFGDSRKICETDSSSISCFGFDVGRKNSKGEYPRFKREYLYVNNLGAKASLRGVVVKRTLSEACASEGKKLGLNSIFKKVQ